MRTNNRLTLILSLVLLFGLTACNESDTAADTAVADAEQLVVYKSPTCGCCEEWIDHVNSAGLDTEFEHPSDLDKIKDGLKIPNTARSCHTAVSRQGFVFEGHIPARYINQFLENPPEDALGLAVPGMPIGSPGMEVDDRFMPYQILLLKADGTTEIFASVDNADMQ